MKPQFDFIVDKENKVIRFADMEFKRFKLYADAKKVLSDFQAWNLPISGKHKNPAARAFSDKYGITASKFKAVFNAKMLNLWVDPIKEHANRFAYNSNGKLKDYMVGIIWEMLPEIEQAKKDGIYNIVPWILHEGKNPQELKEHFGKSNWKKICKQTMTRNKMIAVSFRKRSHYNEADSLDTALSMPSYLLKKGGNSAFQWNQSTKYLIEQGIITYKFFDKRKTWNFNSERNATRVKNFYEDTKRMAGQLGKKLGLCKDFIHSEVNALIKDKSRKGFKLIVVRIDSKGNPCNSEPCSVCKAVIATFSNIKSLEYTT